MKSKEKKLLKLDLEELRLLEELMDDWVSDHFESNVDFQKVQQLNKKVKNKLSKIDRR